MRPILLSLVLLTIPAVAREPAAGAAQPACRAIGPHAATAPGGPPSIRPLGQEPPARQILALLHTEGGCQRPVVVAERVGAAAQTSSTSRP